MYKRSRGTHTINGGLLWSRSGESVERNFLLFLICSFIEMYFTYNKMRRFLLYSLMSFDKCIHSLMASPPQLIYRTPPSPRKFPLCPFGVPPSQDNHGFDCYHQSGFAYLDPHIKRIRQCGFFSGLFQLT